MQEEKQLVPKLRFSEFGKVWQIYKLGEVCKKIQDGNYGGNYPKSDEFVDVGIPFLTSKALGGNGFLKENKIDFIPLEKHKELKKAHLKLNDVLFTNRGSNVGSIGFVDKRISNGNIGPQLTLLRSNLDKIEPLFLYQIMTTFSMIKQVRSQDSGSAMNFFGITATSKFKVSIPRIEEQQKIANFLTSIDTQIQTLEKKKSGLEHYKKGVMQKIFKQELRFKPARPACGDDDGYDFPEWEDKKLGEYLTHKSRRNKKLEVTRTLSVSNSKGFILQSEQFDNHRVASKDVSNYKIVVKNDIAYNPSRINVGSIAILKDFEIGIVSPMYVVFSLKDTLELSFFENLITTHLFKYLVKVGCSGSVRDSLNFNDLENFKLKVPSLKEQTKIANFLSAIDKNIALVNNKIEQTKSYKKGLLQQMFV